MNLKDSNIINLRNRLARLSVMVAKTHPDDADDIDLAIETIDQLRTRVEEMETELLNADPGNPSNATPGDSTYKVFAQPDADHKLMLVSDEHVIVQDAYSRQVWLPFGSPALEAANKARTERLKKIEEDMAKEASG